MKKIEIFLWIISCCFIIPIGFLLLRIYVLNNKKPNDQNQDYLGEKQKEVDAEKQLRIETIQEEKAKWEKSHYYLQKKYDKLVSEDLPKKYKNELKDLIDDNNKNFQTLNTNISDFTSLFKQGSKKTGDLGEALLERMFANICAFGKRSSALSITRQEKIPNTDVTPDLTIKSLTNKFPPIYIDSKFPKPTYDNYINNPNNKDVVKKFVDALKNDIKDIKNKYVDLKKNLKNIKLMDKANFAIIFIPSEDMYNTLMNDQKLSFGKSNIITTDNTKVERTFIELCFENKIVPSSPSTIVSIIVNLERYYTLFAEIDDSQEHLIAIQKFLKKAKEINLTIDIVLKKLDESNKKVIELKKAFKILFNKKAKNILKLDEKKD